MFKDIRKTIFEILLCRFLAASPKWVCDELGCLRGQHGSEEIWELLHE